MNKPVKPGTTIVGPGGHNLVDDITVPGDEHFGRFWKPGDVAPTWSQVPEEVPADGQAYMRQKGVWVLAVAGGKSVTEIVPTMAYVGMSAALPANVYGNGFIDGDVVMWDGVALATAYISPNQLGITIDTNLGVAPSVAEVTVVGATGVVGFHFIAAGQYHFVTGLTHDTATGDVNLQPAGDGPPTLGGVYVIDRVRNNTEGLELGLDGRLRAPLATDSLAGTILEPPPDDKGYVRRRTVAGESAWVPPAGGAETHYVLGLTHDDVTGDVNLTPAGWAPELLGGVYTLGGRSATEGLDLDIAGTGKISVPLATDLLAGSIVDAPVTGLAYSRQWNNTTDPANPFWEWVPALTAGLQITSIIPDKAIYGPTEPVLTVHAYGAEFTPTTVVRVDGSDAQTTYVSPTELTFLMNPAVPISDQFHIITVYDPVSTPPEGLGAEQFDFIKASTEVDYGTGLAFDTATDPPIVNLQPAQNAANAIGGIYVVDRTRTEIQGLELNADGELKAPLATSNLAGSIIEPFPDGKGYVRMADPVTMMGMWVPPADTPGYDYGMGLAVDRTPVPPELPIVNLQPAGDAVNRLGGVWVPRRDEQQGLELDTVNMTGELKVPLATPYLAGSIIEPPQDDKGYVRRTDINTGIGAWVPPAEGADTHYVIGLTHDDVTGDVNLTPAGDAPEFLGGVYVVDRVRNVSEGLELGLDGRLRAPLATDSLAGTILEPPPDDKGYVRRRTAAGESAWVPPADPADTHYVIGLTHDDVTGDVNLTPAGDAPEFLGGVYVIDRERNVEEALELGIDGRLRVPLATDNLAGAIVEPPDDGKGYVRRREAGLSAWVPPSDTVYHFVTGLSFDESTRDVNLTPAADSPAGLGGVYVVERTRTAFQGLELNGDGELKAPLATDLLAGTHTEPPPDGLAYSRKWDNVTDPANPKWVWIEALTAGLQITGLIPDKAILGPTEPIVTVHAYGSSFTPTTVVVIDGTDASATTVISETELTFEMNPAVPPGEQTYIVTVRDTATSEVGLGAESFEFIKSSTSVEYGIGLTLDTTTTPDPTVNLQVANANGGEIGGVKLVGRGPTQGLEYDIATGTLWAPLATDVAAGSIVEPPPDGSQYVRTRDQSGFSEWIKSTASGVIISDTPPDVAMTAPGTMWWESDSGDLFILYEDGDSRQWVEAVAGAEAGNKTHIGDAPPDVSLTKAGDLWWDSDAGTLAVYFTDADSSQWVQIAGPQPPPPAAGGGIAEAPMDGTPYSRQDAAWVPNTVMAGAFLPLDGTVPMTGHITINYPSAIGPGDPQGSSIYLNKVISSQQPAVVFGGVAGVQRWKVNITGDYPSVGADNFQIVSTNDGGGGAVVMEIARATGDMVYGGNMTVYGTVTETLLMDAAAADPDLPGNSMGALLLHALAEIKSLKAEIAYIKANCCP